MFIHFVHTVPHKVFTSFLNVMNRLLIITNKMSIFLCSSRLAESRTNPQVLDIGVNPQDFNTEECLSPGKWDQEDTDFTAQKDTFGF